MARDCKPRSSRSIASVSGARRRVRRLINASDPRGFVKASKTANGALGTARPRLDARARQGRVRISSSRSSTRTPREIGARAPPTPPPADTRPQQRRNLSLNTIAMEMAPKKPAMQQGEGQCSRPAARADAAECKAAAATAQRHPESLAPRRWRASSAPPWPVRHYRAAGGVLSNHFCISANKGGLARMWAAVRARGDRPFVWPLRHDMLKAVEQHPAALFPRQSAIARPGLRAGISRNRGLNENLARETWSCTRSGRPQLHQDDVTSLARVITGGPLPAAGPARRGAFVFNANAHQPAPARARQDLRRRRRSAGRGRARRPRAPSFHGEIRRHQIRPAFCCGRAAAGAGRKAAGHLHQDRR